MTVAPVVHRSGSVSKFLQVVDNFSDTDTVLFRGPRSAVRGCETGTLNLGYVA